jgi:hypothetical protein
MSNKDIVLKEYDMIFATTQGAINVMMQSFITGLAKSARNINMMGFTNINGNIEATTDKNKADCLLKGELDTDYSELDVLDLVTNKGNQTVCYNIAIKNGSFRQKLGSSDNQAFVFPPENSKADTGLWIIKLFVNLSKEKVKKSDLPQQLKEKLLNIDENMFSIEQLFLDINTAELNEFCCDGFPDVLKITAAKLVKSYLKKLQETHKPIFGVTVKKQGEMAVEAPTFKPTSVDFCVTPYRGPEEIKNKNLDTLNYLVMTENRPAPRTTPQTFNFNWVDAEMQHGTAAVKRELFLNSICNTIQPVLRMISPTISLSSGPKAELVNNTRELPPLKRVDINQIRENMKQHFMISYNEEQLKPLENVFAQYGYETNGSFANGAYLVDDEITSVRYSSFLSLRQEDYGVLCLGSVSIHAQYKDIWYDKELPRRVYDFSFKIENEFNPDKDYILQHKIKDFNFPEKPKEYKDDSFFTWLFVDFDANMFNLAGSIETEAKTNFQEKLNNAIKDSGRFIFPGGRTFSFRDQKFSNSKDLTAQITYTN